MGGARREIMSENMPEKERTAAKLLSPLSCGCASLSIQQKACSDDIRAYWQASDANANCRSNLATSLFTPGIKLKNTASNFIPGFPHHHSQCDIYSLARCPFSLPLPLTPPPLSLLIYIIHCEANKDKSRKWCQIYTERKYICLWD